MRGELLTFVYRFASSVVLFNRSLNCNFDDYILRARLNVALHYSLLNVTNERSKLFHIQILKISEISILSRLMYQSAIFVYNNHGMNSDLF